MGLKFIADILLDYTHYFQLFVGIVLILTGVSLFFRKHIELLDQRTALELVKDFTSVLFMNGMYEIPGNVFRAFHGTRTGPFVGNVHAIVSFIMDDWRTGIVLVCTGCRYCINS